MKLWILDADAIIEMLELGVFENLVKSCEVHLATTVINEVKHYYKDGVKTPIDLRKLGGSGGSGGRCCFIALAK